MEYRFFYKNEEKDFSFDTETDAFWYAFQNREGLLKWTKLPID